MVRVTQVSEEQRERQEAAGFDKQESDYADTESEVSEDEYDDDDDVESETLAERIVALRDVIPPQYRSQITSYASSLASTVRTGFSYGGKALWVVTTSSLLLVVPLSLSIVSEQQLMEMEKEMKMTQSTNEVLAPGAEGGFQQPAAPGAEEQKSA
ncbi:hypothetical protein TRICI_003304 [Trichomonascus ciferrii]|uniref:Mitochondrial import receptor subunit Tom22 n=1 Tax=Trichomonascus ciferrii TaxID=44093 RepID=A0A642V453_9ASCO|nr:hypothetical protein TRICI_003304 [Trichomonascus ciferrii]